MASLALLSLCGLVLLSNYIDNRHTENVKGAISTLYEDRLVAEYYILQMTSGLHRIEDLLQLHDPVHEDKIALILEGVKKTYADYLKTKFTEEEHLKAKEFSNVLQSFGEPSGQSYNARLKWTSMGLVALNELSDIQLAESKQIMKKSELLYQSGKANSQYVFATIIIILLVLQAVVFTSKTLSTSAPVAHHQLN